MRRYALYRVPVLVLLYCGSEYNHKWLPAVAQKTTAATRPSCGQNSPMRSWNWSVLCSSFHFYLPGPPGRVQPARHRGSGRGPEPLAGRSPQPGPERLQHGRPEVQRSGQPSEQRHQQGNLPVLLVAPPSPLLTFRTGDDDVIHDNDTHITIAFMTSIEMFAPPVSIGVHARRTPHLFPRQQPPTDGPIRSQGIYCKHHAGTAPIIPD